MRLQLRNIGKLSYANIELNGITVIAGENDTGKSTVGKTLYSIFNSYYDVENQIELKREKSILRVLESIDIKSDDLYNDFLFFDEFRDLAKALNKEYKNQDCSIELLSKTIYEYLSHKEIDKTMVDEDEIAIVAEKIISIKNISNQQLFTTLLKTSLDSEFNGQISNIFSDDDSIIELTIKSKTVSVNIKDDEVVDVEGLFSLRTEVVYIDDPFIMDSIRSINQFYVMSAGYHRAKLKEKLLKNSETNVFEEILINDKLNNIYNKINSVCDGEIYKKDNMKWSYHIPGTSKNLDFKNVSTGLKTFVIIKTLLQNGVIGEKATIVLDEPEIHLHPEWQLLFAEIIVLLQKEFDITILLNTHSPYFLEAIEVYSKKYGIESKCKYYLAENEDNISVIKDVSEHTEAIYEKLVKPLQKLENERLYND